MRPAESYELLVSGPVTVGHNAGLSPSLNAFIFNTPPIAKLQNLEKLSNMIPFY